nr:immunoglobulin heavy chain junction region [Macaca mulatta]MOW86782.1 immunoglobulin heavy chain junction region [Macaca mulatta]MOW98101.1 immunoglobulin heavy chain junction region [Macaca mulatta]MOW99943.1 immunoglobulin heavy chain junction region [Macaca mulatta]MOW99951.1 immunoglobulin heavy chain junction region [Macaca mulatta]
CARIQSNFDYW